PRVQPLALRSGVGTAVARQPESLVPGGAVRYHCLALGFGTPASATCVARHGPVSSSLPQLTYEGVNGYPDSHVPTPANCHPPTRRSSARDDVLRNFLSLPNGSS